MTVKKKKLYLTPTLPRKMTRYRHIDSSSSYIPYIFNRSVIPENAKTIIILDEQEENSSGK